MIVNKIFSPNAGPGQWMRRLFRIIMSLCVLAAIWNPSITLGGEPEDELAGRIRAYWMARSNNDFQSAYKMESSRLRKEITLEKYSEINRNPMLRISRVDISNIVIEGDRGRADVIFHMEINQGKSGFSILSPKRKEEWEKINGVWCKKYYSSDKILPSNMMNAPIGLR